MLTFRNVWNPFQASWYITPTWNEFCEETFVQALAEMEDSGKEKPKLYFHNEMGYLSNNLVYLRNYYLLADLNASWLQHFKIYKRIELRLLGLFVVTVIASGLRSVGAAFQDEMWVTQEGSCATTLSFKARTLLALCNLTMNVLATRRFQWPPALQPLNIRNLSSRLVKPDFEGPGKQ